MADGSRDVSYAIVLGEWTRNPAGMMASAAATETRAGLTTSLTVMEGVVVVVVAGTDVAESHAGKVQAVKQAIRNARGRRGRCQDLRAQPRRWLVGGC